MLKKLFITGLLFLLIFACCNGQNVILSSNAFLTKRMISDDQGFGAYTRMGVEVLNLEIGIKSLYCNLEDFESYGVTLYSFIPVVNYNKWEVLGHVNGGFSFIYTRQTGSDRALVVGLGPSVRYRLRDYFQLEFTLEYLMFANFAQEDFYNTQMISPTLGWSVRI